MGATSSIEWTDSSWSPIRARNKTTGKIGWHCEHATHGCQFCYAEGLNLRLGTGLPFKPGHRKDIEIFLDEKMLLAPLRWKKPRRIFVCSMTDAFADFVPDEWLDKMFAVAALAPQHTLQWLTKRSARLRAWATNPATPRRVTEAASLVATLAYEHHWLGALGHAGIGYADSVVKWPLPNCWMGISAEDQPRADERVPDLLATPAAVRFISAEPLIGPIDFSPWIDDNPVYEMQAKRGVRLPICPERGLGDHAGRDDLASPEERLGPLEKNDGQSPVQEGEGRARQRRVSPNQGGDRRGQEAGVSSSLGFPPLQREADSCRNDDQSRGRSEEEEPSRQSGTGDLFGTADSRDPRLEGGPRLQSGRGEKFDGDLVDRSGGGDQAAPCEGREADTNRKRLWSRISDGIEDLARGKPISLVIVGAESGPRARPMDLQWARDILAQCQSAGVACFVKQLSGPGGRAIKDMAEFPADLRVRQFPADIAESQALSNTVMGA